MNRIKLLKIKTNIVNQTKGAVSILLATVLIFNVSCNQYKIITKTSDNPVKIISSKSGLSKWQIIVHSGENYKLMRNVNVNDTIEYANGVPLETFRVVSAELISFEGKGLELYERKVKKFKGGDEKSMTHQLHVFVDNIDLDQKSISFVNEDIIHMEMTKPRNRMAKVAMVTAAVPAAGLGVFLMALLIYGGIE